MSILKEDLVMKKFLIIVMAMAMALVFCSCGGEDSEEPVAYSPSDIQVEAIDDSSNAFYVIYDITTEKEDWSGYPEDQRELDTAINGIKECISSDDWTDKSVVFGYAGKPLLKNMLYSYGDDGSDGNYDTIKFFQYGVYNTSYTLQDELQ